jgi:hypothetical protein
VGPRASLDRCGKFRPQWDSIPGPSSPWPVAIPTELPGPLEQPLVFALQTPGRQLLDVTYGDMYIGGNGRDMLDKNGLTALATAFDSVLTAVTAKNCKRIFSMLTHSQRKRSWRKCVNGFKNPFVLRQLVL